MVPALASTTEVPATASYRPLGRERLPSCGLSLYLVHPREIIICTAHRHCTWYLGQGRQVLCTSPGLRAVQSRATSPCSYRVLQSVSRPDRPPSPLFSPRLIVAAQPLTLFDPHIAKMLRRSLAREHIIRELSALQSSMSPCRALMRMESSGVRPLSIVCVG